MDLMNVNDPCVKLVLTGGASDQIAIPSSSYIAIYNPHETAIAYVKTVEKDNGTCDDTATFIPPKTCISFKRTSSHGWLAGYCASTVTLNIQVGGGA